MEINRKIFIQNVLKQELSHCKTFFPPLQDLSPVIAKSFSRHCEQSEAIYKPAMDCFVVPPRNDETYTSE